MTFTAQGISIMTQKLHAADWGWFVGGKLSALGSGATLRRGD